MTASTAIAKLLAQGEPNSIVSFAGWVRSRRDSKAGLSFIAVNDGSCFDSLQVVAENALTNYESEIKKLSAGCSVRITGTLVESEGKGQSLEVQATDVSVVGWVEDPETYPIAKKRHTFEYLRTVAHLRPRTNAFGAMSRVRNSVSQAVHRYFHERDYVWVNTPLITTSDCEGAGELFRVSTLDLLNIPKTEQGAVDYEQDFFGGEAFLTVSGQLNAEAYALALSKVYTFGPTFRAENSNTSRHLAEFWMIEPEVAFNDLAANADLAEDFLKYCCKAVLDECPDDMAFFAERVDKAAITRAEGVVSAAFERMLASEHERYLTETHVGRPVILMNYPKDIKAFYMRMNDDEQTVAAMDVLAPGIGEIIGGSQREERLDVLDARLEVFGLTGHLDWYRDLRRYGTVPHAGFGLGFERRFNSLKTWNWASLALC